MLGATFTIRQEGKQLKKQGTSITLAFLLFWSCSAAFATPFWSDEQLDSARTVNLSEFEPRGNETGVRGTSRSLDEIAYFVKYRQLCDFLVGLQVTTPGANLGGMREGEIGSDYSIIQTDNTQEAIRVWSQYAIWTGDTARYAQNIRNAWTYCTVWPAWREEGGGYYAMHNCGWGFEAAYKYREAYNDTTWNWYADSCALWVVANPLWLNGTLNYAAQGLGIGGLYPHAIYRGRNDWRDHALARARLIRGWFEAQPSRLNNATEWALCGGTALWGVCNSLWIAYPDSGTMWINQYGTQLETWETPSNWYNAYNTWYSNATFRCWEITGDSLYWNRGVFYADSLLAFDVDDDGGIPPGTCCISNGNDHSWVSAYMGWMGLERIISSGPITLAQASGVVGPDTTLPLLESDTTTLYVRLSNLGTDTVHARLTANDNGAFVSHVAGLMLLPGEIRTEELPVPWILPRVDELTGQLAVTLHLRYWNNGTLPDTLEHIHLATFDLRRRTSVFGTIGGVFDPSGTPCHIDFYAAEYPDSVWTSVAVQAGMPYSNGARPLLEGNNRMVVTAPPRYMLEERNFVTLPGNTDPFDIWLTPSEVVLVDDDLGASYETYLQSSLNELQMRTRTVERLDDSALDLSNVEVLVWMTGNDATTTLTNADHDLLSDFMQSGGGLLLTGQNISDDPANTEFLEDVLLCQQNRDDTNRLRAYGIGGYPPVEGQFLLLLGSQGAGNQTSPSSLLPLDGATAIFINDTLDEEICGIFGNHGAGKFIFLSFGLEAASGQAGSTTRAQFLDAAINSLRLGSGKQSPQIPSGYQLLSAYPNPFNSSVQIEWTAPLHGEPLSIEIYDVLGRQVSVLFHGAVGAGLQRTTWDGANAVGTQVTSGTYFVRLSAPNVSQSRTIRLIR